MKESIIKEIPLYDELGDFAAIRASLEDICKFINQEFAYLSTSIHYEDDDDYGCEHYLLIKGECADIQLKKDYGGMFCPNDALSCSVLPHSVRDKSTNITHQFSFKEGKEPKYIGIGSEYAVKIREYITSHKQYLVGTPELFYRVDTRYYNDGRGVHKFPDVTRSFSYDLVYVSDDDFYTDQQLRFDIKSCKCDVDEVFEAIRARERYIFETPVGHILVESPLPEDMLSGTFYENKWSATHVINSRHSETAIGESLQDAYNEIYDTLSQRQKKENWYFRMINLDNKKVYGVALDLNNDGKHHSPGEKLYVKLVAKGETAEVALEEAFFDLGFTSKEQEEIAIDLAAGRKNSLVPGYTLHPLSDIAIEYFSDERVAPDKSILIVKEVIEKQSRLRENSIMGKHEWASCRALDDD